MKTCAFSFGFICAAACAVAAPSVDDVTIAQDAATRRVTVNYRLSGEPAVVTLAIETNASEDVWVDVGAAHVTRLAGSVNRIVEPGEDTKTIVWGPDADLPDVTLAAGKIRPVLTVWATNALPNWMSVDLIASTGVRFYASPEAIPGGIGGRLHKTERLLLRRIDAAGKEFMMGAGADEVGASSPTNASWSWTLETAHRVTLTRNYWIGVYPITQEQWFRVVGTRPAKQTTCNNSDVELHPVENISYLAVTDGSASFLGKLRAATGIASFALPTTAQWEFACRAGTRGGLYTGEEIEKPGNEWSDRLDKIAWFAWNCDRTHAVGGKEPNGWQLYDMLGNVNEWVSDWFYTDLGSADQVDPEQTVQSDPARHTTCGGGYNSQAERCRCCSRNRSQDPSASVGFRVKCQFGD